MCMALGAIEVALSSIKSTVTPIHGEPFLFPAGSLWVPDRDGKQRDESTSVCLLVLHTIPAIALLVQKSFAGACYVA